MLKIEIKAFDEEQTIELRRGEYGNGRLAIRAICEDGEQWGVLTVNLPDDPCPPNHAYVKTWSENEFWVPQVLAHLVGTNQIVKTGHVQAELYDFTPLLPLMGRI